MPTSVGYLPDAIGVARRGRSRSAGSAVAPSTTSTESVAPARVAALVERDRRVEPDLRGGGVTERRTGIEADHGKSAIERRIAEEADMMIVEPNDPVGGGRPRQKRQEQHRASRRPIRARFTGSFPPSSGPSARANQTQPDHPGMAAHPPTSPRPASIGRSRVRGARTHRDQLFRLRRSDRRLHLGDRARSGRARPLPDVAGAPLTHDGRVQVERWRRGCREHHDVAVLIGRGAHALGRAHGRRPGPDPPAEALVERLPPVPRPPSSNPSRM